MTAAYAIDEKISGHKRQGVRVGNPAEESCVARLKLQLKSSRLPPIENHFGAVRPKTGVNVIDQMTTYLGGLVKPIC